MTEQQYNKELEARKLQLDNLNKKLEDQNKQLEKLLREAISISRQLSMKLTREILPFHKKTYKVDEGYREMIARIEQEFGDFYELFESE